MFFHTELRRNQTTATLPRNINAEEKSCLYLELLHLPANRLRSKHPIWNDFMELEKFNFIDKWWEKWFLDKVLNYELIPDTTLIVGGFTLERREWSLLNRFRTGFGCCNDLISKCKFNFSPLRDCGPVIQTMHHIVHSCSLRRFVSDMKELSDAINQKERFNG